MGIVVALFIIATGIGIIKDTMNELLGATRFAGDGAGNRERHSSSYEGVIGVHDLMVHEYGPGRMFASAPVSNPSDSFSLDHAQ
jgi:Predicted Co/Zn/Cd cation transporters